MPAEYRVARDGVTLAVWEWPGGDPRALLLHGIGNYGRYWDFVANRVAGRLGLLAPDARGHGDSGKPASGYAPEEFVADAIAILDHAKLERAVVVGHSMGATHALRLAAAHPGRVLRLVVVDAGPEPLHEGAERARRLSLERPDRFSGPAEALAYLRRTSPGYDDVVYANRIRHAFRARGGGLVWRSSSAALAAIMSAQRDDLWAALRRVHCPTLVVRGTHSNVLDADVALRMVRELRDGRLLELEAGHNVALERPRELAEAIVTSAHEGA